jgi:hypothetical protein
VRKAGRGEERIFEEYLVCTRPVQRTENRVSGDRSIFIGKWFLTRTLLPKSRFPLVEKKAARVSYGCGRSGSLVFGNLWGIVCYKTTPPRIPLPLAGKKASRVSSSFGRSSSLAFDTSRDYLIPNRSSHNPAPIVGGKKEFERVLKFREEQFPTI